MSEEKELTELTETDKGISAPVSLLSIKEGFNPRSRENAEPDDEMIKSVKEHGVLRPLHIRNDPDNEGKYIVVDGERRYRAAIAAKVDNVPVIPEGDMDDTNALVLALVGNDNSKPLSPREEAEAFTRLKEAKVTPKEIARVMGRSLRKVEETLRALDTGDEEITEAVKTDDPKEKIPVRAASRMKDLPAQDRKKVAKEIKGKSQREAVAAVRKAEKKAGIKRRGRKATDYPWAKDAKQRAEILEKAAKAMMKDGTNRRAEAHLEIIACLKGKTEPGELYVAILEKAEAEKSKANVEKIKKAVKKSPKKAKAIKRAPKKAPAKKSSKKVVLKKKIIRKKAAAKRGAKKAA